VFGICAGTLRAASSRTMKKPPYKVLALFLGALLWGAFSVPEVFANGFGEQSIEAFGFVTSAGVLSGTKLYFDAASEHYDGTISWRICRGVYPTCTSLDESQSTSVTDDPWPFGDEWDLPSYGLSGNGSYFMEFISTTTAPSFVDYYFVFVLGSGGFATNYVYQDIASSTIFAPFVFSSSTVEDFCEPAANILDVGGGVRYGLCYAAVTLLLPSDTSLARFTTLASTTQSRIPFSYLYELRSIFSGFTASSTANLPALTLSFPSPGSTTPLGNIVPASVEALSSSTIGTYLSEGVRASFLALQRIFLWVGFIYLMYRRIIPHHVMEHKT